jgi:hypothetical protein
VGSGKAEGGKWEGENALDGALDFRLPTSEFRVTVTALRSALLISICLAAAAAAKDPTPAPVSRSAQVLGTPDMSREFNIQQLSPFGRTKSTFRTKAARSDTFYFQQKFSPKTYEARSFETKGWWAGDFKFSTKDASTKGKYEIPNAAKAADTKTAPVKDARESGKTMATRDLPDGSRPYLGKEAQKMKTPLDPNNLPKITNEMHELKTIEDVKELLNKNR